jgi:hypothetical protein
MAPNSRENDSGQRGESTRNRKGAAKVVDVDDLSTQNGYKEFFLDIKEYEEYEKNRGNVRQVRPMHVKDRENGDEKQIGSETRYTDSKRGAVRYEKKDRAVWERRERGNGSREDRITGAMEERNDGAVRGRRDRSNGSRQDQIAGAIEERNDGAVWERRERGNGSRQDRIADVTVTDGKNENDGAVWERGYGGRTGGHEHGRDTNGRDTNGRDANQSGQQSSAPDLYTEYEDGVKKDYYDTQSRGKFPRFGKGSSAPGMYAQDGVTKLQDENGDIFVDPYVLKRTSKFNRRSKMRFKRLSGDPESESVNVEYEDSASEGHAQTEILAGSESDGDTHMGTKRSVVRGMPSESKVQGEVFDREDKRDMRGERKSKSSAMSATNNNGQDEVFEYGGDDDGGIVMDAEDYDKLHAPQKPRRDKSLESVGGMSLSRKRLGGRGKASQEDSDSELVRGKEGVDQVEGDAAERTSWSRFDSRRRRRSGKGGEGDAAGIPPSPFPWIS